MYKRFFLAAALAAAPHIAFADGLSYTYVEGGYNKLHIDDEYLDSPEGDGGYLRGSIAISPSFYAFGSYGRVSNDFDTGIPGTQVDVSINQSEIGLGYRQSMGDNLDFLTELAFVREDLSADMTGEGEIVDGQATGGRINVGVRGAMAPKLEGWLKVGYADGGDFDGTFAGNAGVLFKFNPTWGMTGEVEVIEDTTRYLVGVRASF